MYSINEPEPDGHPGLPFVCSLSSWNGAWALSMAVSLKDGLSGAGVSLYCHAVYSLAVNLLAFGWLE